MKIVKLKDEISGLEVDIETKEDEIVNYKQEIADLRTSLGSCTVDEDSGVNKNYIRNAKYVSEDKR